jgi:hypothetical protein
LTWANVKYTAQWYFVDGAGWPAVAVALYAYAHACVSRRRFVVSPTMVSLWLAFGLVFVPIVVVAQKAGGALLLSVMGIQALSIVRAVALVPRPRPRALLTLAVAACALHHVVAATFLFPPDQRRGGGLGPLERQGYPLWNHRNLYLDIVGPAQREPEYARRMDELADRIEILDEGRPVKDRPVIVSFNSDVAIFQVHNLRCEALLRRRAWSASSLIWMPPDAVEQQLAELRSQVLECDVLVKRTASPTGMNGYDKMVARVTGALVEGEPAPFVKWGDPIVIGNGEEYTLYVRDRAASLPR